MKLEKISVDLIDVLQGFNVRSDFGDANEIDLEESIKITNGNIQPILVCKNTSRYDLISGERRLRALKNAGYSEATCIVYDNLTELEKVQLMFNENLGRKSITWRDEVKALKKLKNLGFDITVEKISQHRKMSINTAWNLFEALEAIEEFPELINEKTRKLCIEKYRKIKRLEKEAQDAVKERKISIKEAITTKDLIRQKNIESMVIEELKEEINHYKEKLKNIYDVIKQLDKIERLNNGVWLKNEIKALVEAARSCEKFGLFEETNKECNECRKENPNIFAKCEFFRDEFERGN
jgi:ParB/RepB/Spo0J family partition protein